MLAHMKAVWASRYFWTSLVKMDLMTRYRRSVLGIGWSLLHPIAMTAVFCVVFSTLMSQGNWIEYAQSTLTALAVWGFLRDTTLQGCYALIRSEPYIRQVPLPYAIYPLRMMLANFVHFVIALSVVVILVASFQASLDPFLRLWAVIPAVLMLAVFAWAVATIVAFATVYFHDVSHITELGAQVLFFLTPIIYTKKTMVDKGLGWLAQVNPVVPFIDMIREPIVYGRYADAEMYGYGLALTVGFVGLAFGVIGWLQKKVIFHL
jgi:lipopolysaccharide transport system permease protein